MSVTQSKPGDGKKSPSPRKASPRSTGPRKQGDRTAARRQGVKFEPTSDERKLVMMMAAIGYTHEQMARQIRTEEGGISSSTLRKHFVDELEHGADRVNLMVANNLFNIATGGGKAAHIAAIYWTKARCGWVDRPIVVGGVDGADIPEEDGGGPGVIKLNMKG